MTETTPDGDPDHIGRAPWWRATYLQHTRPLDDSSCSKNFGTVYYLLAAQPGPGTTLEPTPKPAPVAELTSLTDDTPPSSMGLNGGVFVVFDH